MVAQLYRSLRLLIRASASAHTVLARGLHSTSSSPTIRRVKMFEDTCTQARSGDRRTQRRSASSALRRIRYALPALLFARACRSRSDIRADVTGGLSTDFRAAAAAPHFSVASKRAARSRGSLLGEPPREDMCVSAAFSKATRQVSAAGLVQARRATLVITLVGGILAVNLNSKRYQM